MLQPGLLADQLPDWVQLEVLGGTSDYSEMAMAMLTAML